MNSQKLKAFKNVLLCLLVLLLFSCGNDTMVEPDEETEKPEYAEYDLRFGGKHLIGEDVDSQWKSDIGLVWLSTDDKHEGSRSLYGTLTLNIGAEIVQGAGNTRHIVGGILSHTDKLKGTFMELNGKTYTHAPEATNNPIDCEQLDITVANGSYIKVDYLCMTVQEINTGEIVKVTGSFIALSK